MSEKEQEEIIKRLREQAVQINTEKPAKPQKIEEDEVLKKAKEAGETINDDSVQPSDS